MAPTNNESEPLLNSSRSGINSFPNTNEQTSSATITRKQKWSICILVLIIMLSFFGSVAYGMVIKPTKPGKVYNNGTHNFNPTVIFISLDGVVNHDLDLSLTPHLTEIADTGARAHWMTPSFPPITFPNHWSLVTGLHPEAHGIVGNYFYDPVLNDSFYYKSPEQSWDEKWWGGEPIWITSARQGKKSGVIMWPGCSTEFKGQRPTYSVPFSNDMTFDEKTDIALEWLDLPIEDRPQFIGLYVPQIDQAGHKYGPYANETLTQLQIADKSIGRLLQELEKRNLSEIVHIIVVSDHGMSATDQSRLIYTDDVLTQEEFNLIWKIEMYPTLGIRPVQELNGTVLEEKKVVNTLYKAFKRLHKHYEGKGKAPFQVYKKEDFPARFQFNNNPRIAPLLVLPDAGWNFVTRKEFTPGPGKEYNPKGVHGYDNLNPQSRAIFVAKGPTWNDGEVLEPFLNVELYQVLSKILEIKPSPNNGTLNGVLQPETL